MSKERYCIIMLTCHLLLVAKGLNILVCWGWVVLDCWLSVISGR